MASAWGDSWGSAWGDSWGAITVAPRLSGGIPHDQKRTKRDVSKARERFGIPDEVRIAIEAVAAQQAARLEQDKQKHLDELAGELKLRKLQWQAGYLEALAVERERLINAEIALRLWQKLKDEENLMLLVLMAAAA